MLGVLGLATWLLLPESQSEKSDLRASSTLALETTENSGDPTPEELEQARNHPDLQETEWEMSEQDLEELNAAGAPAIFEESVSPTTDEFLDSVDQYGAYETMADNPDLPEELLKDLKAQGINPEEMILMGASEESP